MLGAAPAVLANNARSIKVFGTDDYDNAIILSDTGNSLGFDSAGNPQINGTFGIQKQVLATSASLSGLGGISPGASVIVTLSATGALYGSDVVDFSLDDMNSSPLGNMALCSIGVVIPDLVNAVFVNTDPVNISSNQSGVLHVQVLR